MNYKDYLKRMERIIPTYPLSIPREDVIKQIVAELRKEGKEIPETPGETIQSVYNQNCEGYSAFRKRPLVTKPYFTSKGSLKGHWSVHPDHKPIKPFELSDF